MRSLRSAAADNSIGERMVAYIFLMHDDADATLDAYAKHVIGAV